MKLKDMTDEELKDFVLTLDSMIYELECYSTSDTLNYEAGITELEERGYSVNESRTLNIE